MPTELRCWYLLYIDVTVDDTVYSVVLYRYHTHNMLVAKPAKRYHFIHIHVDTLLMLP